MHRYLSAILVAALPCLALAVRYFGPRVLLMLSVAVVSAAIVELIFSQVRG